MDPITLIVTALATGASSGLTGAASDAVKDAYQALHTKVRGLLSRRPGGEVVLDQHGEDPETWDRPLRKQLAEAGIDSEVVELARRLLSAVDPQGSNAGKYQVSVGGNAQGTVIGDSSNVHMIFGSAQAYEDDS
jgi:hypothetical protein